MFYIQKSLNSSCVPVTRENFLQVIDSPQIAGTIRQIHAVSDSVEAAKDEEEKKKLNEQKARLKKKLPAWLFMVNHIEPREKMVFGKPLKAAWRKSEDAVLNGLCMLDIDHVENPREILAPLLLPPVGGESQVASETTTQKASPAGGGLVGASKASPAGGGLEEAGILFAHVTPSGHGLRIVFKADAERGNIADNQQWLADKLGVQLDKACKDSVRISFCCTRSDIIYMDLETLLTYNNEEFEKRFGDEYRHGNSAPHHLSDGKVVRNSGGSDRSGDQQPVESEDETGAEPHQMNLVKNEDGEYVYRGVPYHKICEEWLKKYQGGNPVEGERNSFFYSLCLRCLRYICDFNAEFIVKVAPDYGLSREERLQCATSAIKGRRLYGMPEVLRRFLSDVGCVFGGKSDEEPNDNSDWDFEKWYLRFHPHFDSPVWAPVCSVLPKNCKLNGILAAASMFGTLLSGCKLKNWYDGSDLNLTFMTYIIGQAASGKGDYRELDKLIMEPLRLADERGRRAEDSYQKEMKRLASAKVKKEDVPEEKHFAVRYLPSNITLAQKMERCRYALSQFGSEQRQVACYNFETELSSKVQYEKSSWAGSQDFDKKSFDCELTGSESRSSMTTNGLVAAFFNFVVTGTPDALQKKITNRNCLDGLPTRLIMGIQPDQRFHMVERSRRRRDGRDEDYLRQVGQRLLSCGWDVNLEQKCAVPEEWQENLGKETSFADALYYWGQQKALVCSLDNDELGDYFRRRVPLIACRLGVVDAIMHSLDSFEESGMLKLDFSSIELALNMADYIFESQMYYFGKMVQDALDGTAVIGKVLKNTKRVIAFSELPDVFTLDDVMTKLGVARKTASNSVYHWKVEKCIMRISKNTYKKLVKVIV